jgi:hypothetical protein
MTNPAGLEYRMGDEKQCFHKAGLKRGISFLLLNDQHLPLFLHVDNLPIAAIPHAPKLCSFVAEFSIIR